MNNTRKCKTRLNDSTLILKALRISRDRLTVYELEAATKLPSSTIQSEVYRLVEEKLIFKSDRVDGQQTYTTRTKHGAFLLWVAKLDEAISICGLEVGVGQEGVDRAEEAHRERIRRMAAVGVYNSTFSGRKTKVLREALIKAEAFEVK